MSESSASKPKRKPAPLTYLLGFVFVLFLGILVFVYVVTKKTNPTILDEHGRPVAESQH